MGGFVGVDVSFVLSGYLISGLLIRELRQTGRIRFLRFYARRLKRHLPALATLLVIVTAAALWLLSDLEARAQLASGHFAAAWTSNLYFALLGVDSFNESWPPEICSCRPGLSASRSSSTSSGHPSCSGTF